MPSKEVLASDVINDLLMQKVLDPRDAQLLIDYDASNLDATIKDLFKYIAVLQKSNPIQSGLIEKVRESYTRLYEERNNQQGPAAPTAQLQQSASPGVKTRSMQAESAPNAPGAPSQQAPHDQQHPEPASPGRRLVPQDPARRGPSSQQPMYSTILAQDVFDFLIDDTSVLNKNEIGYFRKFFRKHQKDHLSPTVKELVDDIYQDGGALRIDLLTKVKEAYIFLENQRIEQGHVAAQSRQAAQWEGRAQRPASGQDQQDHAAAQSRQTVRRGGRAQQPASRQAPQQGPTPTHQAGLTPTQTGQPLNHQPAPNAPSSVAAAVNPKLLADLENLSQKCNPQTDQEKGNIYPNLTIQQKDDFKKIIDEIRKSSCDIKVGANGAKEHTENGKVIFTEEKTQSGKIKFTPGQDAQGNINLGGERIITVPHVTEQNGQKVETGGYDVLKYSADGKLIDCKRVGDINHSQLDPDWLKAELQRSQQGLGLSAAAQSQAAQVGVTLNRGGVTQPNRSGPTASNQPLSPSPTPNNNPGSGASFRSMK